MCWARWGLERSGSTRFKFVYPLFAFSLSKWFSGEFLLEFPWVAPGGSFIPIAFSIGHGGVE